MSVTVEDIAERAGVSLSTVSRVLNDRGPVAESTAQRVRTAMADLGYSRSTLLRGTEHPLAAVCVPARPEHWQLDVLSRVDSALQQRGVLTATPAIGADLSEVMAVVDAGAALVITPMLTPLEMDIPVVRFAGASHTDDRLPHPNELVAARIDLTGALSLAFDHLSAIGHRRIGLICNDSGVLADHLQARFLAEHPMARFNEALDEWIAPVPKSVSGGADAALRLKDLTCTAVIVQSGLQLYGVFQGIRQRGLVVPRDLSAVGLGDSLTVRYTRPPATVLGFDAEAMAEALTAGARTVLGLPGDGLPTVPPTFRPMLVARRSTTAVLR